MKAYDSHAYKKMDVTKEHISRILELRKMLLPLQSGFNLVNAAVVCGILESISGLEPSSVTTEPRYFKLVTVSNFCPFTFMSVSKHPRMSDIPRIPKSSTSRFIALDFLFKV